MTPDEYQRVGDLYHAALELEPDARPSFLDGACGDDAELRREVDSLLKARGHADNYFAAPAMEIAAGLIDGETITSLVGKSLDHYQVLSLVGAGGMGEVYLAEDTRLGRKVALKLLPVEFTRDADRVRRFEKEARSASALNHPNIITIHEIGHVDSSNYIVTEFVEGETLRQHICRKKLEVGEAIEIATQIASALAATHSTGIVHRDIKPENVMLRPDGLVKVLDFGLAKLTESNPALLETNAAAEDQSLTSSGQIMGTPKYMSPEQARGLGVDARSDIFSLGVVLYEMVAGRLAFSGPTSTDISSSLVQQDPVPHADQVAEVPQGLGAVIAKALANEPGARYQSATELITDLKRLKKYSESEVVSGGANSAATVVPRKARPIWPWALATAVLILLAVGWWWRTREQTPQSGVQATTPIIAVLPFKNQSSDKESDYFADGLTDELIRNLSIIEGLEVRSRTSAFTFKDKQYSLSEVGEKLKVNYVLSANVLRSGDDLRINTQFIRISDDKPLWADKFDKKLKDIFKIQEEISLGIVNALRVSLGRGRRNYKTSVEAYDLYLRAGNQPITQDRVVVRDAKQIKLYEEAIAKDPSFAPAFAKLALIYAMQSVAFPLDNIEGLVAKLRATAEKAIQLDPLFEEAHVAVGRMHAREGRWGLAESSFHEAIRLNPNSSETYIQYADWLLEPVGRVPDMIEQLRHAERADPLSTSVKGNLATALIAAGRYAEAEQYLEQLRNDTDTRPGPMIRRARVRLGQGRVAEAIQILEKSDDRPINPLVRGWLGNAYARAGRREEAEKMAAASEFANEHALIFAGLGDKDRTLAALESMGSRGPQRVGRFLTYPEFAFLQGDPRLVAIRTRVGLP